MSWGKISWQISLPNLPILNPKILGAYDLINKEANASFLDLTQTPYGGYGKVEGVPPDLLHAYMGIASHSLSKFEGFLELDPALNLAKKTAERIPPRQE